VRLERIELTRLFSVRSGYLKSSLLDQQRLHSSYLVLKNASDDLHRTCSGDSVQVMHPARSRRGSLTPFGGGSRGKIEPQILNMATAKACY
jgi:hypothetical protein